MRKIIGLIILSLIAFLPNTLKAQATIAWSKEKRLTWDDFKGQPDENILAYALTAYKIEISPNSFSVDSNNNIQNYQALTVYANFYQNASWVYKRHDYLLKHEQLHFDIAGLYAFKIRQEFDKLKSKGIAKYESYLKVYESLWAKCRAEQRAYDNDTRHGQDVKKNDLWITKINTQLNDFQ